MRKARIYKTLNGLMRGAQSDSISLYEMLDGRFYRNWQKFEVTDELRDHLLNLFASAIWSKPKTHTWKLERIENCGILRRVMINKRRDRKTGKIYYYASYCAGQDYPSEIRFIQRLANK